MYLFTLYVHPKYHIHTQEDIFVMGKNALKGPLSKFGRKVNFVKISKLSFMNKIHVLENNSVLWKASHPNKIENI